MLRNLKQFFDRHILAGSAASEPHHALRVATAALLFEVMRTDGELKDAERQAVTQAIRARFDLSPEETAALLHLAEAEARQATDYYQFTALINAHFNADQKAQIIEYMWEVAYADRELDRFERTLVHKIADLLHVPRPTQIASRERARRL
jgi:uncharacterized tellurite resistance protein B-like protein